MNEMTMLEQFQQEQAYNQAHPRFAPLDDEEMGERLPGLFRTEIEEDGHLCVNIIFDNGEHFVYDCDEETMYHVNKFPEEFFIHKYLEKVVYDFIIEHKLQENYLPIYCVRNEVKAKNLIKLLPHREECIVELPNIMLPSALRGKGLGLKLISEIYAVCKRTGFRLIISMMVQNFYQKMISRGATSIDFETVEINDNTLLGKR